MSMAKRRISAANCSESPVLRIFDILGTDTRLQNYRYYLHIEWVG
jgi:hypothetical protein